jgi:hypothetical protein
VHGRHEEAVVADLVEGGRPIRVMIRIEVTTYGLSVISTPSWLILEPSGPMQNGTTYIVRPRMQPANSPRSVARISAGRPVVGRAGVLLCSLQMKVRSSTRATSLGSDRQ